MSTLLLTCLIVTSLTASPVQQASREERPARATETATQFYLRWRSTALNAKSVEEIIPFWTAETIEQFNMEPDSAKADTLAMMKRFYGMQTEVKVIKETATANGATLFLEALDRDKAPVVATVDIVKENGSWKISAAVEQWQPKRTPISGAYLISLPSQIRTRSITSNCRSLSTTSIPFTT